MNILFLENHAIFAKQVIQSFLPSHPATVVPSLSAGRLAMAHGKFDLILCDYDLDDGKGDEFVRRSMFKILVCPSWLFRHTIWEIKHWLELARRQFVARWNLTIFKRSLML